MNELSRYQGELPRYPLACEPDVSQCYVETNTSATGNSSLPLDSVVCTDELSDRPARQADYETENRALATLISIGRLTSRHPANTVRHNSRELPGLIGRRESVIRKMVSVSSGLRSRARGKPYVGGGTPRILVLVATCSTTTDLCYSVIPNDGSPICWQRCLLSKNVCSSLFMSWKRCRTIWAIVHDVPRSPGDSMLRTCAA